ncbi:MAG: DUF3108 domain-containing protein [Alphaproteobacteria bacterium]|nr:DUF3108 domain-containing protein [Alphaproteobacteria bacterium]
MVASLLRPLAVALGALIAVPAAGQQPPDRVALAYDVYTGGLQVIEFGLDIGLDATRYDVLTRLKTRGFYATLFPWEQVSRATGQVSDQKVAPLRYEQRGRFRGSERTVDIDFRSGRVADIRVVPTAADDNDREVLSSDDVLGAVDPLSGVVSMLIRVNRGDRCEGSYDGFDGRRRFNIAFTDRGPERVEGGGAGTVAGQARGCSFVWRQTGGFVRRVTWGADRQREPQTGRVWLAEAIARAPVVPIKVEIDSNWGRTLAYLRRPAP